MFRYPLMPDEAIDELNERFKEHDIGYAFTDGQIIRIDSEYVHQEMTEPALSLISDPAFVGSQQEFLKAHKHYNKGETKDAIVDALNAVESVMKTISTAKGWTVDSTASFNSLVSVLVDRGFIPKSMRSPLEGLASFRNKSSAAHGQGPSVVNVPPHDAAFALHLAASNIVYLVKTYNATK
jgi:hypothetical protein